MSLLFYNLQYFSILQVKLRTKFKFAMGNGRKT